MPRRLSTLDLSLLVLGIVIAGLSFALSAPFPDARHLAIALLRALLFGGIGCTLALGAALGALVWRERRAREEWHLRRMHLRARATFAAHGPAPAPLTPVATPPDIPSVANAATLPVPVVPPAVTAVADPAVDAGPVWTLELLAALDWRRFEDLCAGCFRLRGYRTESLPLGTDGGIHVNLYRPAPDDRLLGILLCRACGNGGSTGVRELRELYGMMAAEAAPLGIYVSRSGYSTEAVAFAQGKHLKLLDPAGLLDLLLKLPATARASLYADTVRGDYTTPSCPHCGEKMRLRTLASGQRAGTRFWLCRDYPGCRGLLPLRAETAAPPLPLATTAIDDAGETPRSMASTR